MIPHAGKRYAGLAREAAFSLVSPVPDLVIYIAALHREVESTRGLILHKDPGFPFKPNEMEDQSFDWVKIEEHSFDWVQEELRFFFEGSQILVLAPTPGNAQKIKEWIINFLRSHPKTLVIATTDLIHYGDSYGTKSVLNKQHPQSDKIREEETLIKHLTTYPLNTNKIVEELKANPHLACGREALKTFAAVMEHLGFGGKVVDYFDSSQIAMSTPSGSQQERTVDLYTLLPLHLYDSQEFVSYVSIVYGPTVRQRQIAEYDIWAALGLLKSTILMQVHSVEPNTVFFPRWSPFHTRGSGIFVGTTLGSQTNCSYGRYEQDATTTTAQKIGEASADCLKDARNRWQIPYSRENLAGHRFKIEFLASQSDWGDGYHGEEVLPHFRVDGTQGVFLSLPSGRSATYLPVVARENAHWSPAEYLGHLSRKAGGGENDWKNATIYLYTTSSYTSDKPETWWWT